MTKNVLAANLVVEQVEAEGGLRLRLAIELPLKVPDLFGRFRGSSPITPSSPSSKAHQKSGSFPPPELPGLNGHTALSDSAWSTAVSGVEAATYRPRRVSPDYPHHYSDVPCPLPRRTRQVHVSIASLSTRPSPVGPSAFTLSRPAQTLLTLRPAGSLNRPRRPLSRGFDLASCLSKPLVSYRINRQLSGWNLPPQVMRAFGAHSRRCDTDDEKPDALPQLLASSIGIIRITSMLASAR